MQELTQMISMLGFPCVACIALAWFVNKLVDKLTTTIQENTMVIQKLVDKLEGEENGGMDK